MYTLTCVIKVQTRSGPIDISSSYTSMGLETLMQRHDYLVSNYDVVKTSLTIGVVDLDEGVPETISEEEDRAAQAELSWYLFDKSLDSIR